jgi:hypothetical protein
MKLMLACVVAIFTFVIAVGAPSDGPPKAKPKPPAEAVDITGYYRCEGEIGGEKYGGIVLIRQLLDIYKVNWMLDDGGAYSGVGMRHGDSLSVSWLMNAKFKTEDGKPAGEGTVRGITVYRIEGEKLLGLWLTMPGSGRKQVENLEMIRFQEGPKPEKKK